MATDYTGVFPDPFLDMASFVLPPDVYSMFKLSERIWLRNGTYRMAAQKIVRYFITQLEFENYNAQKHDKLKSYLNHIFNATEKMTLVGDDLMAYGVSLSSVVLPFRRLLFCTKCHSMQSISTAEWSFRNWKFYARCSKCRAATEHTHSDVRSFDKSNVSIKRWSPHDIRLKCHPYQTSIREFYWSIPRQISAEVIAGNKFYIEHMPWEVIETIKARKLFKFNNDVVYYMFEPVLSGIETGGWGVSRLISNLSQAWYTQILKRSNEALANDYAVPFRVITPAVERGTGKSGSLLNTSLPGFANRILSMIASHRRDPADWNVLPFPVEYQSLGAEAKALATPELITNAVSEMLNASGFPAELYNGTLQFQALPTALRLFQQTWPQLTTQLSGWLEHVAGTLCTAFSFDRPERVFLQPVRMADDIELRQMWLNLASSNLISRKTAFAPWGVDASRELDQIFSEQRELDERRRKYEEDAAQRQSTRDAISGMMPPGTAPATAAGGPVNPAAGMGSVTPQDLIAQAQEMAARLVSTPYEMRRSELVNLKATNPTLHAMVKAELDNLRQDAASQGQQAILQGGAPA